MKNYKKRSYASKELKLLKEEFSNSNYWTNYTIRRKIEKIPLNIKRKERKVEEYRKIIDERLQKKRERIILEKILEEILGNRIISWEYEEMDSGYSVTGLQNQLKNELEL